MVRLLGVTVLVLTLCRSQVSAQVSLELKYLPGSKSVSEIDVKTHQILT